MTYFAIACFVSIFISLGAALIFMLQRKEQSGKKRMARALALRISISILLFTLTLLSYYMGWIQPRNVHYL